MAARDHAKPTPKKTFTELLPVTLPIDESAYSSWTAAHLLANVSGKGEKMNLNGMLVKNSGLTNSRESVAGVRVIVKADFQSSHEAPRSSLRVLTSN
jgi:hypothetical protein